ncbi:hypothetical protein J9978_15585 [Chromobacterium violaceum]|uniref:hypothetical protein n=1 Tax=Chromobacterium violaceum TaxID=536 RepID=UPI001B3360CB|nr:hypothetical protein [Chromobacterium violaceum]MBP4050910.1 hypothetical protein [Chromobacterium violaceum]
MEAKNKRPLYFISGEDFYFVAYSILLVLEFLGGSKKRVKDHRKLTYLIQFISDGRLIGILSRTKERMVSNPVDREFLFSSFANAELHKREVFKILFSLERGGYISIQRTEVAEILDVALIFGSLPKDFFGSAHFDEERRNADELKKLVPKISMLTFDSLLERLYTDRGVRVWAS